MVFVEESIMSAVPKLGWMKEFNIPLYGYFPFIPTRIVSRTIIVCITTIVVSTSWTSISY